MNRHAAPPPNQPDDTTESTSGDLLAGLADDVPVMRVLWVLARGINTAWALRDMCDRDAIRQAITEGWVAPPEDELIAFHLTDKGRDRIRAWCGSIRDVRDTTRGRDVWHTVTGR